MNDSAKSRRSFLFPKPKRQPAPKAHNLLAQSRHDAHKRHNTGMDLGGTLICARRDAMATKFEVNFPDLDPRGCVALASRALNIIDRAEDQLTVYRENSEVSRLNATAHDGPIQVSRNLYDLIERSKRIWEETGGAFDITAGRLVKVWGIHSREYRVPSDDEIDAALERVGMQHVHLHPDRYAVSFDRPGIELNFGSNGKGYALDCAAAYLREEGMPVAYLQGGGSSHYGMQAPPWDVGWWVEITDPGDMSRGISRLCLTDRGMAMSGIREAMREADGTPRHHIIDPRDGRPAEEAIGVVVVAPLAEEADALATAFSILGVERARKYCQTRPDLGMLLVPTVGSSDAPEGGDDVQSPIALGLLDENSEMMA